MYVCVCVSVSVYVCVCVCVCVCVWWMFVECGIFYLEALGGLYRHTNILDFLTTLPTAFNYPSDFLTMMFEQLLSSFPLHVFST